MVKNVSEEKFRWIKPILERKISIKSLSMVCPFSERSLKYWLKSYRDYGLGGLKNKSTRPRTQPKETAIRIKERVLELRKETNLSAIKLSWKLEKEGIDIHRRTIGKILKKEGLVRKYRTRKIKYRYLKALLRPGELVEIDIKYVPHKVKQKKYYQFTAIDTASRWRYLRVYPDCSTFSALCFTKGLLRKAPFEIKAIKTDNGSCFTNRYTGYLKSTDPLNPRLHPLDIFLKNRKITHYLIDPGKPQQNGKVERSHRTDQEHFYNSLDLSRITVEELKLQLKLWNMYYNDLEHCGLSGLSPNQYLKVQNVCA